MAQIYDGQISVQIINNQQQQQPLSLGCKTKKQEFALSELVPDLVSRNHLER